MLSFDELVDEIKNGCKPKEEFRIGVEHEQFSFDKTTNDPLTYDGKKGVGNLLKTFATKYNWQQVLENGNPIALTKDRMSLTIEPGGQIEYAGSPLLSLQDVKDEMTEFQSNLHIVADELGIGFLQKGVHPNWKIKDINLMPKARYKIMSEYMPTKGKYGLDMMFRTCGSQLNLDYKDEADMVMKFRVCLAVQPIIIALMANSQYLEGSNTGYASYRAHIWTDTDSDRCGFPSFVFDDDMGFEKYVEYALDVPMYFIIRDNKYINMAGKSFREFMAGTLADYEGQYATLKDWQDHITTVFPEVRLKQYLELRSADSCSYEMVMAMTAFWVGILYDDNALNKTYDIIKNWSPQAIEGLYISASKDALAGVVEALPSIRSLTKDLLEIANAGLKNQPDNSELLYLLEPFFNLAKI